jgi:hypothetical protein
MRGILAGHPPRIKDGEPWDLVFGENFSKVGFGDWQKCKARLDAQILTNRKAMSTTPDNVEPMPPWVLHDLRRAFSTEMNAMRGRTCDPVIKATLHRDHIEECLCHVEHRGKVRGVYDLHSYQAEKAAVLKLWNEHLLDAIQRATGDNVVALPPRAMQG